VMSPMSAVKSSKSFAPALPINYIMLSEYSILLTSSTFLRLLDHARQGGQDVLPLRACIVPIGLMLCLQVFALIVRQSFWEKLPCKGLSRSQTVSGWR
jgi:hypothetical protein